MMVLMCFVIFCSGMMRIDVNSFLCFIYYNSLLCFVIRGMLSFWLEFFVKLYGNFILNLVFENFFLILGRFMGGKFSF